jgi:predicted Ser/Thr protein kinase
MAAEDADDRARSKRSSEVTAEGSTQSVRDRSGERADIGGQRWGRYRLTELVGAGSFGSVYRAWDPELEREVAVKILHGQVSDAQLKDSLLREGRALAKVRHSNVVSVYGVEFQGDRAGLCMEFVRGETLEALLQTQGVLTAREAALAGVDVARALAAVHAAGFVHRDVKARNVMVERAGRVVLMDFGTGQQVDHLGFGPPDLAGTPVYMSPEVLDGQPASPSSDVYGVGVLLYHLVTGEYPVSGRTFEDVREGYKRRAIRTLSERRPDLPSAFCEVVDRALSGAPDQRYGSANALLDALQRAIGAPRGESWSRGSIAALSAIAVCVLVGALTALGFLTTSFFNMTLERSDFDSETFSDWLVWGIRSLVAPAFLFMGVLLVVALVVVVRRLAMIASPAIGRLDGRVRRRVAAWAHRARLDEAPTLFAIVLLLSASAMAWLFWHFSPLVSVILSENLHYLSTGSTASLAVLSPRFKDYQEWYQLGFSGVAILTALATYAILRLGGGGHRVSSGMIGGAVVLICFEIMAHSVPYRLLVHNEFDRVKWNDADCYVLGERGDMLLFCPSMAAPRIRVIPAGTAVRRIGIKENVFSQFGGPAPGSSGHSVSR